MQVLKQSTTATILVGPVLDEDGVAYTGAVIGDFQATKNGVTAALASAATATHSHNGMYLIELTTGNTDTLGRLDISLNKSTYGMTNHRYEVLSANQFDALVTNGSVTPAAIADAVWDEPYSQHTTAGTFGKLMDILRKSNLTIEGTVSNAITPTTLTFSSNVSATTSAYAHAVLLFVSGPLAGENSPIISYTSTNGVFVLEEPLTAAPSNGDEFVVIAGSHVHAIADITAAIDINVAPFSATLPQRVQGTRVDVFYKEAIAITIAVFDGSNDPVDLTTQGSLRVCIERRDGTDLQTIENANITIGGGDSNQFTFTCDATATGTLGQHYWSLRRTTNNEVLAHGQWQVLPAAFDT